MRQCGVVDQSCSMEGAQTMQRGKNIVCGIHDVAREHLPLPPAVSTGYIVAGLLSHTRYRLQKPRCTAALWITQFISCGAFSEKSVYCVDARGHLKSHPPSVSDQVLLFLVLYRFTRIGQHFLERERQQREG